jgi:hypothetical protein
MNLYSHIGKTSHNSINHHINSNHVSLPVQAPQNLFHGIRSEETAGVEDRYDQTIDDRPFSQEFPKNIKNRQYRLLCV